MPIDRVRALRYLKEFDLPTLFRELLGWDKFAGELKKNIDGVEYILNGVSEKRGFAVLQCNQIPNYGVRLKIDKQVAKDHFEHLIIFADKPNGRQVWQWTRRERGKPHAVRAQSFHTDQSGELLLQKLENLKITLDQDEETGLSDVTTRVRSSFDVEKVTKKFYERFKAEHEHFLKFVNGIPDEQMKAWYASVMINRLMFLYFIQAKSFLNADPHYLINKLKESRDRETDGYYRGFLCPLFFQGFARKQEERTPEMNQLLGDIPYLNGGLFQQHQIELQHGNAIQITDQVFDHLFSFFQDWDWHLDDRPASKGNEINPDVLGYIFEKYINQKQMGAYYTKEDITGYIAQNTIIPFLLDATRRDCSVAFDKSSGVWRLLRDDPDRYIYAAVQHGTKLPLPPDIAAGISEVKKRTGWNKSAPSEYALPTEIWREVVERRRRYEEVRGKLASGDVHEGNDLITLNLDIRQFAQDVIQYAEGPELVRAFYKSITKISVLDPTCGSGAFLFAALNILKPLYEACLQRMQMFVDELDASGPHHPKKFEDLREILNESRQHPKQDYFILKSIIVNNLYGVDIMEEAVEICKLRLFLKLVAQLESSDRIEPLPDIDFNIIVGNALVGYAYIADVNRGQANLYLEEKLGVIEDKAHSLDSAITGFRIQQTKLGGAVTIENKQELQRRFIALDEELSDFLAAEYGVKPTGIEDWRNTHKPFHWCSVFHRIMASGGFNVIIGNPPYIELSKIRRYQLQGYATIPCGNLFCPVVERAASLCSENGCLGMIIPMSFSCTERMGEVRKVVSDSCSNLWLSHFSGDAHPAVLFDGVKFRLDIMVGQKGAGSQIQSSPYQKWFTDARPTLFSTLKYSQVKSNEYHLGLIPKSGQAIASSVLNKLLVNKPLRWQIVKSSHEIYVHRVVTMFVKGFDFIPFFSNEVDGVKKSEDYKPYTFVDAEMARLALGLLNSSTFFFYFIAFGDCFHCGKEFVESFPAGLDRMKTNLATEISKLSFKLIKDYKRNSVRKVAQSKVTGRVEYDEFWPRYSKPIIDEIDTILAKHYGFTDEELDFIINYDIKYRLGADADED